MAAADLSQAFQKIGGEFRIGTSRWWGDVIIGTDAIYLLRKLPARVRGAIAIFELVGDRYLPSKTLADVDYVAIPEQVRSHPAWPANGASYRGALIVPKNQVEFLYHERGKLETRFVFDGVEISIPHGRFGGKKVKVFAEANAWPMFWDGMPINVRRRSAQELQDRMKELPFGRPALSVKAIAAGIALFVLPLPLQLFGNINSVFVGTVTAIGWFGGAALAMFGVIALRRGL